MPASFTPREKALSILTTWWIVAALAILGGLAGLGVFATRHPVYESQVTLTMGINFARTGILEQYDKDLALGTAAGIIYSTDVMQQVVEAATRSNIPLDYETLKDNSSMERKNSQWILSVQAGDPEDAAFLANTWIDIGIEALNSAYQHALTASSLQDYIDSLEYCMQQVAVNAVVPLCPFDSVTELQSELADASAQLFNEKQASRSLFPEMTFQVDQRAVPGENPVLYGRNNSVLAGMLIGLLAGIAVVSTDLPANRLKKARE